MNSVENTNLGLDSTEPPKDVATILHFWAYLELVNVVLFFFYLYRKPTIFTASSAMDRIYVFYLKPGVSLSHSRPSSEGNSLRGQSFTILSHFCLTFPLFLTTLARLLNLHICLIPDKYYTC